MSSEDSMDRPGAGWSILRAGGGTETDFEIATIRCETETPDGAARLALGSQGEARLLLPVPERTGSVGIAGAPALAVGISTYAGPTGHVRFLDLSCLSCNLEGVFGEVVSQVLSRIRAGNSSLVAAATTIDDFRALLVRPSSQEVAVHEMAGLVGELLYLNRLLDRSPEAWRAWRGPAGDRHDFRKADLSVEAKTSLRRGSASITVNGIHQLEPPTGGSLFLQHFELEAVAGGSLSVRSLGGAALSKASNPTAMADLLAMIGCPDTGAEAWNTASFRHEGETLFRVSPGFPRLVPSLFVDGAVPVGISEISYIVDLTTAGAFVVTPDVGREIEERLAA